MAVARSKTWIAEILTASDLNGEFDNILDNQQSLGSPRTAAFDLDGQVLIMDAAATTTITADTQNQIDIQIASADDFQFTANTFTALSGSSITIASGTFTITSGNAVLTSGNLTLTSGNLVMASGLIDMQSQRVDLDNDNDTSIRSSADDQIDIEVGASDVMRVTATDFSGIAQASKTNLLLNGDFRVAQRLAGGDQSAFTAGLTHPNDDDKYIFDRWILVSDGNDAFDVTQETTTANLPAGSYSAAMFESETANKQCGIVQVLEARDSALLIGGTASLSFKAISEAGPEITNIRAAIIAWDSTADTVTSDVVGTWAGGGTDPTLATNWTYENTPSNLTLTASWQAFTIEDVSIDTTSTTNVGVFIWVDDTTITAGDVFKVTDVQLNLGGVSALSDDRIPMNSNHVRGFSRG